MAAGTNDLKRVDLVFEGGGVKALGLAGAYAVLEEQGWRAQRVAGASAGALVASLVAARYTADELARLVEELDFAGFRDEGWEDRVPVFGRILSLVRDFGVFEGDALLEWLRDRLGRRGVQTFADVVRDEHAETPLLRYRLHVIVSDVTTHSLLVLPRDAHELGVEPDDLEVALAVRASASIPIFFEPVRHANPATGETHLLVDGGMLSNFPVWIFDDHVEWPTFGLLLVEPTPRTRSPADRLPRRAPPLEFAGYLRSLAETLMQANERRYLEEIDFARTITIPTLGIGTTEFDLSRQRAHALYQSGRRAATDFLGRWDADGYRAAFELRSPRSRRDAVAAAIRRALAL